MFFNPSTISKLLKLPTPYYYYDTRVFELTVQKAVSAAKKVEAHIHYALKANHQSKLLRILAHYGIGADCVSMAEIKKALENNIPSDKIVFAGVGKTDEEIYFAISEKIFCLNVESIQELEVVNTLASSIGCTVPVALRINPNVDAYTHKFITTGLSENKFGINVSDISVALDKLKELKHLQLKGLHFHIGSQITDLSRFKNLCFKVNDIQRYLAERSVYVEHLNMGGGLGIQYMNPDQHLFPDFEEYFQIFKAFLEKPPHQKLHVELGRALVAQCGVLISKVLYHKASGNKFILILDSGMNHLIRPALYEAYHHIQNLSKYHLSPCVLYDVAGPVCETTDYFGKNVLLPPSERGDILAIRSVGAYGEVMASNYNLRGYPSVYLSDEL